MDAEIQMLTDMGGWSRHHCRAALALTGGSLERAAELLLSGFQLPTEAAAAGGEDVTGDAPGADDVAGAEEVEDKDVGEGEDDDEDEEDDEEDEDDDEDDDEDESEEEDDESEEAEEGGIGLLGVGADEIARAAESDDPVRQLLRLLHLDDHPEYLDAALAALDAISRASPEALVSASRALASLPFCWVSEPGPS